MGRKLVALALVAASLGAVGSMLAVGSSATAKPRVTATKHFFVPPTRHVRRKSAPRRPARLPATGLDLSVLASAALALIAAGFLLRIAAGFVEALSRAELR